MKKPSLRTDGQSALSFALPDGIIAVRCDRLCLQEGDEMRRGWMTRGVLAVTACAVLAMLLWPREQAIEVRTVRLRIASWARG